MVIKRFDDINENNNENKKIYIFAVHHADRTYRGSIWDSPSKPWVPDDAELVAEFELKGYQSYITINQDELDEINKIKDDTAMKKNAKKYNV